MNKTKKIIGISVIVVVTLMLIVGMFWHFTNAFDRFRSDEALFFKYLGQNMEGLPRLDLDAAERFNNESFIADITLAGELEGRLFRNRFGQDLDSINNITLTLENRTDRNNERYLLELRSSI